MHRIQLWITEVYLKEQNEWILLHLRQKFTQFYLEVVHILTYIFMLLNMCAF